MFSKVQYYTLSSTLILIQLSAFAAGNILTSCIGGEYGRDKMQKRMFLSLTMLAGPLVKWPSRYASMILLLVNLTNRKIFNIKSNWEPIHNVKIIFHPLKIISSPICVFHVLLHALLLVVICGWCY